jgi:F-type H+-transporting ATPase subunit b
VNFDWTTFALETVNFLILVWLLKRFLYRPVLDVIARRQASVAKTLGDAESARAEVRRLQAEYEGRRRDWERERAHLRQELEDELDALRAKRMVVLAQELENERKRNEAARRRDREVERRELETRALQQADAFVARLLERFAGPALDARIVDMLLADLEALPAARRDMLTAALAGAIDVNVCSARSLESSVQQRVESVLAALAGGSVKIVYTLDPALLAGMRLRAGAWELAADLAGELTAFSKLAAHD